MTYIKLLTMKITKTHFMINVIGKNNDETIQIEAAILGQFYYRKRLWIVHNNHTLHDFTNYFSVSDYETGIKIGTSYSTKKEAIEKVKDILRQYSLDEVYDVIQYTIKKYNVTKFNEI